MVSAKRKWSRIEHTEQKKKREPQGLEVWRYSPIANIPAFALSEQAPYGFTWNAHSFAQSANGVESNTPSKKRKENRKGSKCGGIALRQYIRTLRLKSKLFDLRVGYTHTDNVGILPGEEKVLAGSTTSVIRTDYIPSGNTPLRKAQMESNRTHRAKKEKRTC